MPITWDVSGAGSYERLVDVQQGTANNSWTATVALARTKRHHVMLVNSGGPRIAQNITLTLSCAAADGCPVTTFTPTGCGCHVGAAPGPASLVGLASVGGLLAALLRRRRRRQRRLGA